MLIGNKMEGECDSLHSRNEYLQEKVGYYIVEELEQFKELLQEFYQIWVELHNKMGATNYINIFTCSHLYIYMKECGYLNQYLQQGWQALNALIKLFFFCRTKRVDSGVVAIRCHAMATRVNSFQSSN